MSAPRKDAGDKASDERDVCLDCGGTPTERITSKADGRLMHGATISKARGSRTICGGTIGPAGEPWRATLRPGGVVWAYPTNASMKAHLVRLGRPVWPRAESWSATALCGATPSGSHLWVPVAPTLAGDTPCRACESASMKRSRTELRTELDALTLHARHPDTPSQE
jgi:hypothetical protein